MCGRNSLFPPASQLESRFDATLHFESYRPRYNIAPGETLAVIPSAEPDAIVGHHWGLRPAWMDEDEEGFINARSETAADKPSFRDAWAERPCLVLSSGFYEWRAGDRGPKQPFRIHRPDDPAFAFAGLWEPVSNGDGIDGTVTILTTEPNELMGSIHDRMPVVLPRDEETEWLTAGPEDRAAMCRPYPDADLEAYPISRRVNDPSNDDPAVVEPAADPQSDLDEFL